MKNFYFKRSNGEEILLLANCTEELAMQKMNDFLSEHNFKCYYIRIWTEDDGKTKVYDVGSHTEFFKLKEE